MSLLVLLSAFCAFPLLLLAAEGATGDPDVLGSFVAALKDYNSGEHLLALALAVGGLVALTKQGWFSAWVAKLLPARFLPALAFVFAGGAVWSTEVTQGANWRTALLHAFMVTGAAVLGHQGVVEGALKGNEIVPVAPYAAADLKGVAAGAARALMPLVLLLGLGAAQTACTPQQAKTVENLLLSADETACVILNAVLPVPGVLLACKINDALTPAVQNLIDGVAKARMQNPVGLCGAHAQLPLMLPPRRLPPSLPARQRAASLWTAGVANR
jgi:hypothetical protein